MIDLHTHSTYSDGTVAPAPLIRLAEEAGLTAVALCDHDTVAGLPEFLSAARESAVEAVPGVEFSTDFGRQELHILGLFIEPEHYGAIDGYLRDTQAGKEESQRKLIRALQGAGIFLDYEKIRAGTPKGQVNRALIAAEMMRLGYVPSVKEAFHRWLSPSRGYYIPPRRVDVFDAIAFLKSIGAVVILAHAFLNVTEPELRAFLPRAKAAGLDGMETLYPKFTREQTLLAGQIAREFDLLHSGGSDFHGENKPDIRIGTGRGNISVPEAFLAELKARRDRDRIPDQIRKE